MLNVGFLRNKGVRRRAEIEVRNTNHEIVGQVLRLNRIKGGFDMNVEAILILLDILMATIMVASLILRYQ